MKNLIMALAALAFVLSAHAAEDKAPSAQQKKMVACNKDATGMKGDERKAFMKDCLSAKSAAKPVQQDKMK